MRKAFQSKCYDAINSPTGILIILGGTFACFVGAIACIHALIENFGSMSSGISSSSSSSGTSPFVHAATGGEGGAPLLHHLLMMPLIKAPITNSNSDGTTIPQPCHLIEGTCASRFRWYYYYYYRQ
tara:strand:+ start:139 stop:516 length:378 start_codon:yes stop_codon:yes gene_type:complete